METYVIGFLDYLKEKKGRSKNTLDSYKLDLYQFLRFLQENRVYRLEKVTETNLNSYLLAMEKEGMKTASIAKKLTVLRGFFDFCIRRGYIREDPSERLKAARPVKETPKSMTKEEVGRLLNAPDPATKKGIRDRAILGLLYGAGLQAAELAALKKSDVNQKLGFLQVRGNVQDRVVSLPKEGRQALDAYMDTIGEGYLFPSRNGGMLTRQAVWKIVKEYGQKAGLEHISPQLLRNSLAMHLRQAATP